MPAPFLQRQSIPILALLVAGALLGRESAEPASAATRPLLPWDVAPLLWVLLVPVALFLAGVLWLGLVRREARRQSGETSRRTAELEAWYQDLFDNAHDILFSLNLDGCLTSLNRAGRAQLVTRVDSDANLPLANLVSPQDQRRFLAMLDSLRSGTATAHGEIELDPSPDQRVVWRLNLRLQSLPGRSPEIRGVAWDVTEQRRAQDALRDSEQRLRCSLEERIRIGRDLHDGIIQSIYAVGLSLGECRRLVSEDPSGAERHLETSLRDLNTVIREVRGFIEGLEPGALKGREFQTALESIAESLGAPRRLDMTISVDSAAANLLTPQQSTALLQLSREALSNTLRHSQATQASILLAHEPLALRFEFQDNGYGFDPQQTKSTGLGLRNMEARIHDAGGRWYLQSAPGQGVRLTACLPNPASGLITAP